jgi:hypothetical protein
VGVAALAALFKYGFTPYKAINSYYGELLQAKELKDVTGPHYWKDGRIFWVDDHYIKSSSNLSITSREEIALPESFAPPARFVSDAILADRTNVYLKLGGRFQKVLENFNCWYVCGSRLKS